MRRSTNPPERRRTRTGSQEALRDNGNTPLQYQADVAMTFVAILPVP